MKKVSSDIIKIVFHFLGSGARFPTDIPGLCRFFYRISRYERYKKLMANMIFDDSQSYPMCDTIEQHSIDRLQKSDLLFCIGPGLKEYEVSEALAEDGEYLELFSDEEIRQIREIAELFRKEFIEKEEVRRRAEELETIGRDSVNAVLEEE